MISTGSPLFYILKWNIFASFDHIVIKIYDVFQILLYRSWFLIKNLELPCGNMMGSRNIINMLIHWEILNLMVLWKWYKLADRACLEKVDHRYGFFLILSLCSLVPGCYEVNSLSLPCPPTMMFLYHHSLKGNGSRWLSPEASVAMSIKGYFLL